MSNEQENPKKPFSESGAETLMLKAQKQLFDMYNADEHLNREDSKSFLQFVIAMNDEDDSHNVEVIGNMSTRAYYNLCRGLLAGRVMSEEMCRVLHEAVRDHAIQELGAIFRDRK